jgi:hypothetical protein
MITALRLGCSRAIPLPRTEKRSVLASPAL